MINFEIHHNILNLDDLNLESNIISLSLKDKEKIDLLSVLQVKEKAYFQRDMGALFRDFLDFSMTEHKVYLILIEEYPQAKNKIRTKKGLFYKYRMHLEKSALFELEVEVSPNETLFAGIIRLTPKNINFIINHLNDIPFSFGLISPQGERTFKTSKKELLEKIVLEGLKHDKIFWKNWLKIATILAKAGRKFFYLQDLSDTEYFRVFYEKSDEEWERQLDRFFSQKLQVDHALR